MIYHDIPYIFAGPHFHETPIFVPWVFFWEGRLVSPKKLQREATPRLWAVRFHRRKQGPPGDGTGIRAPHLLEAKAPRPRHVGGVVVGDGWYEYTPPDQAHIIHEGYIYIPIPSMYGWFIYHGTGLEYLYLPIKVSQMFVKYTVHGWYGVYRGCVFLALVENGNSSLAIYEK